MNDNDQARPKDPDITTVKGGFAIGIVLHLICQGVFYGCQSAKERSPNDFLGAAAAVLLIGLTQWVYLVPAAIAAVATGRKAWAKGLLLCGAVTLLLNGICFVAVS
jgi:hypothetical protein